MLGRGVILCEGITEKDILLAAAEKMETANPDECYPLDLAGVSVIAVDGDGALPEFGAFFRSLNIITSAFFDKKKRSEAEKTKLSDSFHHLHETVYTGSENMLIEETPPNRLWELLIDLRDSGEKPDLELSPKMPPTSEIKKLAYSILKKDKGSGYAGRLIELCALDELPNAVTTFLYTVYNDFKKPEPIPSIDSSDSSESDVATPPVSTKLIRRRRM